MTARGGAATRCRHWHRRRRARARARRPGAGHRHRRGAAAINSVPYGGRPACIRCGTCAGFACHADAKSGTHNTTIVRAVATGRCDLLTDTTATRLITEGRRVVGAELARRVARSRCARVTSWSPRVRSRPPGCSWSATSGTRTTRSAATSRVTSTPAPSASSTRSCRIRSGQGRRSRPPTSATTTTGSSAAASSPTSSSRSPSRPTRSSVAPAWSRLGPGGRRRHARGLHARAVRRRADPRGPLGRLARHPRALRHRPHRHARRAPARPLRPSRTTFTRPRSSGSARRSGCAPAAPGRRRR